MLIVGWEDPAYHELGVGYGKQVKEALAPCTSVPDPYVNNIECSTRECHRRGGWVQVPASCALPALAPGLQPQLTMGTNNVSPPAPEAAAHLPVPRICAAETLTAAQAATQVGGHANLARLRAVKARYDPRGVFSSTPFRKALEAGEDAQAA